MCSSVTPKENNRLTAVVLEGPGGNVFFKLIGPMKTAQKMSGAFAPTLLNVKKSEAAICRFVLFSTPATPDCGRLRIPAGKWIGTPWGRVHHRAGTFCGAPRT